MIKVFYVFYFILVNLILLNILKFYIIDIYFVLGFIGNIRFLGRELIFKNFS